MLASSCLLKLYKQAVPDIHHEIPNLADTSMPVGTPMNSIITLKFINKVTYSWVTLKRVIREPIISPSARRKQH